MMKFHTALSSVLASLVALPAVGLGDERGRDVETLAHLLEETNRALQVLGGIEQRVRQGDGSAASLIRQATEAPMLEPRERDERLVRLREEVNLLQTELDSTSVALHPGTAPASIDQVVPGPATPVVVGPVKPVGGLRSGLSEAERHALERALSPDREPGSATERVAVRSGAGEHPGYSADPLAQARACYRAEQYERGVELLVPIKTDPASLYWKGRCLEKLGRLDEAIAALARVIELDPNAFDAERAASDIEFLKWKLEFVRQLPEDVAPKHGTGAEATNG